MAATVTLASTTLADRVLTLDTQVKLASVAGVIPGYRLWVGRESMKVLRIVPGTLFVDVRRGQDGTAVVLHSSSMPVWIARPDWLYQVDPFGAPPSAPSVVPYINTITGRMWVSQGDALPIGQTVREWIEVLPSWTPGDLGVLQRTLTPLPTAST